MYSEMLGNKYFLSRNYEKAAANLQFALNNNPINKPARKKLIICYSQLGQIQKAFEIFYSLVYEDADFIIDTDLVADDCPCPELVKKYGKILPFEEDSSDLKLMLGMLWLYCDAEKSLEFFTVLKKENPNNEKINNIISVINDKIELKKH